MCGPFQFTLPAERGFQLLLFFMATGLDLSSISVNRERVPLHFGPQVPQLRERRGEVLQRGCLFLFSMTNKSGIKGICYYFELLPLKTAFVSGFPSLAPFFQGETRHETNLQHFSHTPTHKSHFLPDLKCSGYRVVPVIRVDTMPLPLYITDESNPETRQREK